VTAYMTRVELHDATWEDYTKLHGKMKAAGFSQTIKGDDGVVYELPPAEYYYVGQETRLQVLEKAKQAARAVKPSFAVVVTESNGVNWLGLKVVRSAVA
jgi:hypothetical protein